MQQSWREHDGLVPTTGPTPSTVHAPAQQSPAVAEEGIFEAAWRILRRRWLVLVTTVVLVTATAVGLSLMQPKQYTASVSLLFGTASEGILNLSGYVDPERQAATNESLLGLRAVAVETSKRLGGTPGPQAIADAVTVVSQREGDLVDVEVTTTDPELSAEVADAYGNAFIAFRQRSEREQIQAAIDLARRGQATMTREQRTGEEGQALRDRINQLETAKALQTGGAELVQPAVVPTEPSAPQPVRNGIVGLMLGAILGFALAALLERSDRAIKSVEDLERISGWPILARVPRSRRLERGADLDPHSAEQEAFRMLRASLRYFSVNTEIRSLLVTSARSGEGKSTTARRLAETMAAVGDRVVLVEADMHRHAQAEAEIGMGERGLSGYLVGMELRDALLEVPVAAADDARTLTVLPSGPLPPNPTELLESDRMHRLMDSLEDAYDMVIIDSPPLPVLSDAITLVGHVSGILVVTAVGVTTTEDIRDVSRMLGLHGSAVLGLVANFAPGSDRIKGYYGNAYHGVASPEPADDGTARAGRRTKSGTLGRS